MSGRPYSDNPSTSPTARSTFEMEQLPERDGVLVGNSSSSFRWCQSRNLALVFFFVFAFYMAGTDILESRDMTLPDLDDDAPLLSANQDDHAENEADGNHKEDDADDQTTVDPLDNKVNLKAKNPQRDGVEFISATCNYTCMTDRLPHESPLYPGHVLCNREHRFGMNEEGEFVLQDCNLNTTKVFWSPKDSPLAPDQYPIHFQLQKNGYFQIISDPTGDVVMDKHPKRNIPFYRQCLYPKPKLDCPYLHLHSDGVVVINWIDDETGEWNEKNIKRQYEGLFPSDNKG